MTISRKKILEKIAGKRSGIEYHLDEHIPAIIGKADRGLIGYWRKEVTGLIDEMRSWAKRLSKHDGLIAEADEYQRRLEAILNERLRQLDE